MKEELAIVLNELGADGIQAFYAYLFIEYVSLWIIVGLSVWGIRTLWKNRNDL